MNLNVIYLLSFEHSFIVLLDLIPLNPGLEAQYPARRREERGCGPVTGKDRASCQSGGAPALRPGAVAQSPGREAALAWVQRI